MLRRHYASKPTGMPNVKRNFQPLDQNLYLPNQNLVDILSVYTGD